MERGSEGVPGRTSGGGGTCPTQTLLFRVSLPDAFGYQPVGNGFQIQLAQSPCHERGLDESLIVEFVLSALPDDPHRAHRNPEVGRHLFVGEAAAKQRQYLRLASGKATVFARDLHC